jgi:hypothetical protein
MGRMLEALRRPEGQSAPADKPVASAVPADEPVVLAVTEPAEKATDADNPTPVPFIEVGGPRTVIDASPDVLAAKPPLAALLGRPKMESQSEGVSDGKDLNDLGMVSICCSWTLRAGMRAKA